MLEKVYKATQIPENACGNNTLVPRHIGGVVLHQFQYRDATYLLNAQCGGECGSGLLAAVREESEPARLVEDHGLRKTTIRHRERTP